MLKKAVSIFKTRTIVGHCQDGNLGDRSAPPTDPARPLVDGREIRVHVPGEAPTTGHLLSGRRHLRTE